jgi:hypothetical protein
MLNFPEWIIYALMVPPLALTCLVALLQALGFESTSKNNNNNSGSPA